MSNEIDRLNKTRKRILFLLLAGTAMAFILFMTLRIPTSFFRMRAGLIWDLARSTWFLTIAVSLICYLAYRIRLWRKNIPLASVNDERIKVSWLRAYRLSFMILFILTIFWKWEESGFYPDRWRILPIFPLIILPSALISVVASFLWYSRESGESGKDEDHSDEILR